LGNGDLLVIDAGTRQVVKKISMGKSAEGILMPADGMRAFVAASGDDMVKIVDLKTLVVVGEIDGIKDADGMAWRR
jgi:DNA-binding beta-propeller fold protein YncE